MVNMFNKVLDPKKIIKIQNLQYSEKLLLEDTVPAQSSSLAKVNISSLGHFFCQYLTGHFETLALSQAAIVDDGISHLRGKMSDGNNQRQLFNDYVPLDLFLSPGRVRSSNSTTLLTTDPPSNNLFYPIEFQYMFTVNSEIILDVKNDSDTDLSYAVVFHGVRLPEAFREVLMQKEGRKNKQVNRNRR